MIDEVLELTQSRYRMRFHQLILSVCAGAVLGTAAEPATENKRALSLEECYKMALEHNLDVQIQRLNPEIAKYNISYAYAGYDPSLTMSGNHSFNLSSGTYYPDYNITSPGSSRDGNSFTTSVQGVLPTGLRYSLSGNSAEQYGLTGGTDPFTHLPTQNGFKTSSSSATINLTQPLLKNFWIDSTRMNIQISKKTLKGSELTLRNQIITTLSTVEQAYYDLVYAYQNVKVQEEALQLSRQLLKDNQYKVKVGVLAPLDEKQAQSQVASSEANLLTARQSLATQQNTLKNLIHDNFSSWNLVEITPTTPLTVVPQVFSVQDSWNKGLSGRPDLLEYRVELEKQDITLRYQRNQLWPQLDLIGSYGHSGVGDQFSDSLDSVRMGNAPGYSYGAQIVIPLSNKAARMNYKVGKAQKKQMLLSLKKLEEGIMVQIDNAVKQAQTSLQLINATREARLFAEAALDAEQKKLENGKSTPFVVLSLQRDLTSARSAEIQAQAAYNKALSALAAAEGSSLERDKLSMTVK